MSGTHILNTGDRDVPYTLVTSERASRMRIDVELDGVRVTVPEGHPGDPHAFVREKSEWIRAKHEELEAIREQIPERSFEAGASFPFLGTGRTVSLDDRAYSIRTPDKFVLSRDRVESSSLKDELEHLYRREARKVFENAVEQHADPMDVTPGTIAVRNQKTRWASCSSNDTLSFNWRVIMAPEPVVRYVVIHELAHLRERNHSNAFWQLVESHDPDCHEHARWLKDNAPKLVFDPPEKV